VWQHKRDQDKIGVTTYPLYKKMNMNFGHKPKVKEQGGKTKW
jgi:hypothetical protein